MFDEIGFGGVLARLSLSLRFGALLLVLFLPGGCGLLDGPAYSGRQTKPTVKIGSTNFGEQVILAELYAAALEGGGYKVERQLNSGSRETVEPALEAGRIDLLKRAPADLRTILNGVSAKLTTAELTRLNAQATLDKREPRAVALEWLRAQGLTA